MMTNNTNLSQIKDIYGRSYLLGLGAEILIVGDDSDLVQRIEIQKNMEVTK